MAKPHEKLAEPLAILKELQEQGRRIFKSDELTRVHRERLVANGFLRDVIKGWVMSTGPQAQQQDTTPWYASFWEFCSLYCNDRFGKDWFLSPEQSLLLQAEAPTIPPQVVVNTPKGKNNRIDLLFGTSLYDLAVKEMPEQLTEKNGQRVLTVEAALIRVPEDSSSARLSKCRSPWRPCAMYRRYWPSFLMAAIPPWRGDSRAHSAA
ncbi:hypothetical protein ACFSQQ_37960 [Mesorhizobium kowhaii]|uniref:hypothetical protein n=1 Tax=Mesorhizobium kowhaii TaxID=1300272 RepID=UPI0035E85BB5